MCNQGPGLRDAFCNVCAIDIIGNGAKKELSISKQSVLKHEGITMLVAVVEDILARRSHARSQASAETITQHPLVHEQPPLHAGHQLPGHTAVAQQGDVHQQQPPQLLQPPGQQAAQAPAVGHVQDDGPAEPQPQVQHLQGQEAQPEQDPILLHSLLREAETQDKIVVPAKNGRHTVWYHLAASLGTRSWAVFKKSVSKDVESKRIARELNTVTLLKPKQF